jgi:hypothetical protein
MFTLRSGEGIGRRDFLRVGGLGCGGLTLADMLAWKASAAEAGLPVEDKAVVFLFMHGGPPQAETFDPKMDAPSGVRSTIGEIKTKIPGVTFGSTLEKLAGLADKLAIVRSFTTGNGNHDIKPIVGKGSLGANLGSLYARVAGANRVDSGMPTNVGLFPRAVVPEAQERVKNFGDFTATGPLGSSFAPFVPGGGGNLASDMTLNVQPGRLDDRRDLLGRVDAFRRQLDKSGALEGVGGFQEQAFDTILGGVAGAFDLSGEDPRTVARYDTAPLVPYSSIRKVWNNHKNYRDHVNSLGKLMLMARRLVERGCGFVTVTTNFVWDFHADKNNATVPEGMHYVGLPFDHAVSAFIEDIHARGLQEKVLLVCCGEMGRTPKVNAKGGRDHWGKLAPLMLSGGGLNMGQVIGESTRDAGEPNSDPVTQQNLLGTIMHTLLDVGQVRLMESVPREVKDLITSAEPIRNLA